MAEFKCLTCGTAMDEQLLDGVTGVSVWWCPWCGTLRVGHDNDQRRWHWKYPEAE